MSFQWGYCPKHGSYEYYQKQNIVPPCPICGWGAHGGKPLTSEEFYKSLGVGTPKPAP